MSRKETHKQQEVPSFRHKNGLACCYRELRLWKPLDVKSINAQLVQNKQRTQSHHPKSRRFSIVRMAKSWKCVLARNAACHLPTQSWSKARTTSWPSRSSKSNILQPATSPRPTRAEKTPSRFEPTRPAEGWHPYCNVTWHLMLRGILWKPFLKIEETQLFMFLKIPMFYLCFSTCLTFLL